MGVALSLYSSHVEDEEHKQGVMALTETSNKYK